MHEDPQLLQIKLTRNWILTNNTFIFINSSDTKKVIKKSGGQDIPWKSFLLAKKLRAYDMCPFSISLGAVYRSCVCVCVCVPLSSCSLHLA
jgi:hypothetical protein